MDTIDTLAAAHRQLRTSLGETSDPEDDNKPTEMRISRGWVPFPLADSNVGELESLAGFTFSPLLRSLFQTKDAMITLPRGVHGVSDWTMGYALEKNRDFARAREEYGWELPKMVAITWDEDFLAVTEKGKVVRVCNNEGNIDNQLGTLESWLAGYTAAVQRYAADPDGFEDDEEEYSDDEDGEDEDD